MNAVVVTSWSADGGRLYGHKFMQRFERYWPASTGLVLYADTPEQHPRATVRGTWEIADWAMLSARWRTDAAVHGWSTAAYPRPKAYSYLWDAARFAVKVFVMREAARTMGPGILTWLDGDTTTLQSIPKDWTAHLLGRADVAYLGRGKMHPETGYLGLRVPQALPLLEWCCQEYLSERFREHTDGWTDCHIVRAGLNAVPIRAVNLTAGRYLGESHIWPLSPLAEYVDHAKGRQRKACLADDVALERVSA